VAVVFASNSALRSRAQDVLLDFQSPPATGGVQCVVVADWNGDGIPDLAVGAPEDATVTTGAGAVRIHSGLDGSILASFYGVNTFDFFGATVAALPDLDGDGIGDLAVSDERADFSGTDTGSVYIYSGGTGAVQRRIDGPANRTLFGSPLGAMGDVDGDGIADL